MADVELTGPEATAGLSVGRVYPTMPARMGTVATGASVALSFGPALTVAAPVAGGDFPGDNVYQQSFVANGGNQDFILSLAPTANANMLSGADVYSVWVNGIALRYQAIPDASTEYGYHAGTTSIICLGLNAGDVVRVFYNAGTATAAMDEPMLPRLTWTDAATITVNKRDTDPTLQFKLQDGNWYTFVDGVTFSPTSTGLGFLDEGAEAGDTWYYLYLVPSGANLDVVGSDNAPSTGPTGYTNHRYIGACRNDSGSDLKKFTQLGTSRFEYRTVENADTDLLLLSQTAWSPATGAWVQIDISAAVPATADGIALNCQVDTGSGDTFYWFIEPGNPPGHTPSDAADRGGGFMGSQEDDLIAGYALRPLYDGTLSYYISNRVGAIQSVYLYARAWTDGQL